MLLVVASPAVVGCASGDEPATSGDLVVTLPDATGPIDFDDLRYASRIGRLLVPAVDAGLYLVDPDSGQATGFKNIGSVNSADEGEGVLFVADRRASRVAAIDPVAGRVVATAETRSAPDYVRYVASTGELWVTEKGRDAGIEVFVGDGSDPSVLVAEAFIAIPEEPEGLTIAPGEGRAYSHTEDGDVVVVDLRRREVVERMSTGCAAVHGIPAVDERRHLVLAGCAAAGRAVLLDVSRRLRLSDHTVGGGEALMASGPDGRFTLRSDPGTTVAVVDVGADGKLTVFADGRAPRTGHCLTVDDAGHVWTCDARRAAVVRYTFR